MKHAFFFLFLLVFFSASLSARESETIVSGQSSDALAMIEERFASLSGSLGKMSEPPKFKGTLALPPDMEGRINVPGGRENFSTTQEGEKQ